MTRSARCRAPNSAPAPRYPLCRSSALDHLRPPSPSGEPVQTVTLGPLLRTLAAASADFCGCRAMGPVFCARKHDWAKCHGPRAVREPGGPVRDRPANRPVAYTAGGVRVIAALLRSGSAMTRSLTRRRRAHRDLHLGAGFLPVSLLPPVASRCEVSEP